jgi:ephrin-B
VFSAALSDFEEITFFQKMFGQLVLVGLLFVRRISALQTHFVYWNTSNPIFHQDNADHMLEVNQGNLPWEYDQLNLICPNSEEQHVIYSVSREEYMDCRVTSHRPKIVAICNRPERFLYFTITFRSFSPTPGGLEFKPGHTYYLISTSNARDLHRRVGGYCSSHNMRMIFNVADTSQQASSSLNSGRLSSQTTPSVPTPSSIPVYYYRSKTPAIHTSDYIYYYSPRDLVQLKLKAKAADRNLDNEVFKADRLTSAGYKKSSAHGFLLAILAVAVLLVSH